MNHSFLISRTSERGSLLDVADRLGWKAQTTVIADWCVLHACDDMNSGYTSYKTENNTILMMGIILNGIEIVPLLSIHDSTALVAMTTANHACIAQLVIRNFGLGGLALLEGSFVGIEINHQTNAIRVFTDCTGMASAYVTQYETSPVIASEIKLLCRLARFTPSFIEQDKLSDPMLRPDDFSLIRNIIKVKPGALLNVAFDGRDRASVGNHGYHAFLPKNHHNLSRAQAIPFIDALLRNSVQLCVRDAGRIAVPLSGGLDSGIVTALAMQFCGKLMTFSIGTKHANEFSHAAQVAQHLGSQHEELVLSDLEVLQGLVEAIYFNEISDGLSAEIQAPLFALYKKTKNRIDTMVTGYGADLLFGGVLPPQLPGHAVNVSLWGQIYRTRWTGEFSTVGAAHYGIAVHHPFWNNRLLGLCLDMDPGLKISPHEVKIILREYANLQQLLPTDVIWRKKVGIHEGSGIDALFGRILGTEKGDYDVKSRFTYFVYRYFLENFITPAQIDGQELLHRFARQSSFPAHYRVSTKLWPI